MKTDAEPEVKKSSGNPLKQARSSRRESRQNNSSDIAWRDVPSDLIRAPLVDIDFFINCSIVLSNDLQTAFKDFKTS